MTKKDQKTLNTLPSVIRFMVNIASDPRGYQSTEMTVRQFFRHYRSFCKSNDLQDCLTLSDFARALPEFDIQCSVRDTSLAFTMVQIPRLRESLIADLGLSKRFFNDPESLEAAAGIRNAGIAGDFAL